MTETVKLCDQSHIPDSLGYQSRSISGNSERFVIYDATHLEHHRKSCPCGSSSQLLSSLFHNDRLTIYHPDG